MTKRAVCLYRVSTKMQLMPDQDDIPMQKKACYEFAQRMGFEIIGEYAELGVSGYKVSEKDRDKIQDIRAMAEKRMFDVLLVFMCDRLGRKADETPFVVEWFIRQGVEVWSVVEGQQRIETHVDKLTNYIRYWQAEGESEKTSLRVKEKQAQMLEACEWRGGFVPYGYRLVPNGKLGKKNRALNDLVKDPDAGVVVDMLWDFVVNKGYGTQRLANHLNAVYPREVYSFSKLWTAQSIRDLLRNPIYKGSYRLNGELSPVNEAWRYVTDSQWKTAQELMELRIARKYPKHPAEHIKEWTYVPEGKTKASVFGASMLSGILFCGHCGTKLVGSYHARVLRDDDKRVIYHRPIYRCYTNANKAKGCTGFTVYSARIIEGAVMKAVHLYFDSFQNDVGDIWRKQVELRTQKRRDAQLRALHETEKKLEAQGETLKQEVIKCLMGESAFQQDMIQNMLNENDRKHAEVRDRIVALESMRMETSEQMQKLADSLANVSSWASIFDSVSPDEQKMILRKMIQRIDVTNKYHITIHFFITKEDFRTAFDQQLSEDYSIEIIEADYDEAL